MRISSWYGRFLFDGIFFNETDVSVQYQIYFQDLIFFKSVSLQFDEKSRQNRIVLHIWLIMVVTTIKLGLAIQQYYHTMGIYPKQPNHHYSINARNLFFSLSMTLISISTTAFFIFKAKSIGEHAETLYIASTQMTGLFIFLVTFWKMPKILKIIEKSEELIEKSKFRFRIC